MIRTAQRAGARELLDLVLDEDSFTSWDLPVQVSGTSAEYQDELARAAVRGGTDESVLTGEGLIGGRRVAVVVSEFGFLGGSIGVAAAGRLLLAIEQATARRLPLLAAPASGGTRMQEGTVAFLTMVAVTAAITEHKAAGLPYLVYLRHPTAGGVFASWGSLGHVTIAEPGALVGFLGPRVYQALTGTEFPAGVQTAENLRAHGVVDAVVAVRDLRVLAGRVLDVLLAATEGEPGVPVRGGLPEIDNAAAGLLTEVTQVPDVPAWESVTRSRARRRPGVRELLAAASIPYLPLRGTGAGETGAGLLLALARFGSTGCVVIGQDRRSQASGALIGPATLRTARRGMDLAEQLGLPLVTILDTPGAALSVQAEEGGLAGEIARSISDLMRLRTPTLAVLLGQGTGGAALALLPTDRVVAAQHAWLSPLPPEGASAIVHRDIDHAPQMAAEQGVRSRDLLAHGIVDAVMAETPDAADDPAAFCRRMAEVISDQLASIAVHEPGDRSRRRAARYRAMCFQGNAFPAAAPPHPDDPRDTDA